MGPEPLHLQEEDVQENNEGDETVTENTEGADSECVRMAEIDPVREELEEDMMSDEDLKVSQKRKNSGSGGSSNIKVCKTYRGVNLSQDGDSDFMFSQESQNSYPVTDIKRFLEQTKGLKPF